MKHNIHLLSFLILFKICLLFSCSTVKHAYYGDDVQNWSAESKTTDNQLVHTLWLIGDTGELDDLDSEQNFVVDAMANMMDMTDKNSSVIYLGDNIYPRGMPSKKDTNRAFAESIIKSQLEPLSKYQGKTYFIPGNHDWNKHKKGGRKAIKRQEEFIENYFENKRVKFYPSDACGDPKAVKVNKDLVYIFIDSQWYLQDWSKEKKMNRGCEIKSRVDFHKRMEELFLKYKNDEIICLLHHPIKSNGNHGGYYSLKQHLVPTAELGIWFPLPVIGSLYPIYRQVTGSKQDITNTFNQELVYTLDKLAKSLRINVVFASGHEHGMAYFESGKVKYIVSGAGGKTSYIQSGGEALYARQKRGFAKINFYENFESWVEFYSLDLNTQETTLEFKRQIRAPRPGTIHEDKTYPPITTKDTIYAANDQLGAKAFKRMMLGEQYRDMWTTPVKIEIIDLETKLGGLTPIKKGGGMASNSLRMQHETGKQYILRSIKKDYTKLVPEGFGDLKLIDVMRDQNSASHPYGALAIPALSKAAGVYYTSPKLTYLKHQRGLGDYNSQFPEELYLLEERPAGNWEDHSAFGNSKDIIGYVDVLDNLVEKKNHFVDQNWVLKSRLFDLWIHDWDRHDDQWRWAKFKNDGKTLYRPIPRDRDQAFYKFKGVLPSLIATFLMRKFKTIKGKIKDVKNLSFNAKHFDRYFLNSLSWEEWEKEIKSLQDNITDDAIEKAMLNIPKEVQHTDNAELIDKLKSRKNDLMRAGKKLYNFLSKEVDISGTNRKDIFNIDVLDNGLVKVEWYIKGKKNEEDTKKYERTFDPKVTKEIRLFGLRGKDDFNISGNNKSKIKIRIVGGEDNDNIKNLTAQKVVVYDESGGSKIEGPHKDNRNDLLETNEYDREEFKYNVGLPSLFFGSTPDDGFWFGGGYSWTNHGWRANPYQSKQAISFRVAPGSQEALQLTYNGDFPKSIGNLDFNPLVDINFPRYENYFGFGNASTNPRNDDIQYNWVRMQSVYIEPLLKKQLSSSTSFRFGPILESHDVKSTEGRVSNDEIIGFGEEVYERRHYLGGHIEYNVNFVDSNVFPSNGFKFHSSIKHLREWRKEENVTLLDLSTSIYIQLLSRPKMVLAYGAGYTKSWGELQFHQFADLGNTTNLRGYRNNRFRGESALYHNIDLRMHLFNFKNAWLPMEVGVVGGFDSGRVWYNQDTSEQWHSSRTVGVWMNILGVVVVQPYYSFVDDGESDFFSLRMGFTF